MNILVTGGNGFIGSYLVNVLTKTHDVIVLDNGYRDCDIPLIDAELIEGSITDDALINKLVKSSDAVIHLAGISQVMTSIKHPDITFEYNIKGTEVIANACCKAGKKLYFSSSREVYGSQEYLPVSINTNFNPENPYAASKISGEMIIQAYSKAFGLEYGIFRLSNVYGHGDSGRVLPIFVDRVLTNEDLTIYGNDKLIDFVHVDDVVDAILKMLSVNTNFIVNIGSGIGYSLEEVAKLVIKNADIPVDIVTLEPRKGEIDRYIADISEAKSLLEWNPSTDFETGLKDMITKNKNA